MSAGANGTVLAAILTAYAELRGTLLELPPTATVAGERFASAGLRERAIAIPRSFSDPLSRGADAYLVSDILHDWTTCTHVQF